MSDTDSFNDSFSSFSGDEHDNSSPIISNDDSSDISMLFEDEKISAHLQKDIDRYEHIYGIELIDVKDPVIDIMDIHLMLYAPLSKQTAKAWRINVDVPLTITLKNISSSGYMYCNAPIVEVYQKEEDGTLQTQSQLTFIVGQFVKKQFDGAADKYYNCESVDIDSMNQEDDVNINITQTLLDMGYTKKQAKMACSECETVQQAVQYLIDNPKPTPRKSSRLTKKTNTKSTKKQKIVGLNSKNSIHKRESFTPNYGNGMLCEIARYVIHRIPTLNDYCVICDQTHLFSHSLLKPAVCRRELCAFTYQQFNIVSDVDMATQCEVIDLLVSMAKAAANSKRNTSILNPFPTLFDPTGTTKEMILNPDKPDYNLAREMLNELPVPCDDSIHRNHMSYSLLQWIINSNRTHLIRLSDEYHIKSMDTPYQYIMLSAPPEKEERFQQLKAIFGSKYAFHGSRVENWYSIVRNGLRNASGTKLQLNGAAYGKGIYLADQASTSFGYSQICNSGLNTNTYDLDGIQDGRWACLALCEVVPSDTIHRTGGIWVVPDEDCVLTRFFFVYKDGKYSMKAFNANTNNPDFLSQIQHAMTCIE